MASVIYIDNHATTRIDPRVLERMMPFLTESYGNAASRHHVYGWKAEEAVEAARTQIARLIGATPREIVFTSGATEGDNLAIAGSMRRGKHVITQATEHKAVLDTCAALAERGAEITVVPVDQHGWMDPGDVKKALRPDTAVVSIMLANNEVGTIQDIAAIGAICREAGVWFHTDAVQGVGKIPFDVESAKVDIASLSAHKMYGPKGIGALYVRRRDPRVTLQPLIHGGGHERGMRSGTLNVPAIVGFGEAAGIALDEREQEAVRIGGLRDELHKRLASAFPDLVVFGHPTKKLPGNLNVAIPGMSAEELMLAMPEIAVSSGAACASAQRLPSHVLSAIGVSSELAQATLRFGIGRFNTADEIQRVAEAVLAAPARAGFADGLRARQ